MQGSKGYTVLSPIKVGGKRRAVGAHVEADEIDAITAEGLVAGGQLTHADEIIEPDPGAGFDAAAAEAAVEADRLASEQTEADRAAAEKVEADRQAGKSAKSGKSAK